MSPRQCPRSTRSSCIDGTGDACCDEAGQLTAYSGPGDSAAYAYDTNGNRRSQVRNGISSSLSYAAGSNRLLTSPRGQYSYAPDGSVVSDGIWSFGYDAFGRMNLLTGANAYEEEYARSFDGQGMRVRFVRRYFSDPNALLATGGAGTSAAGTGTTSALRPATAAPARMSTSTLPPAKAARSQANTSAVAGSPANMLPGGIPKWITTDDIRYLHADSGQLLGEYNTKTGYSQETIWFNGQPVGAMINGVLYTVRSDHLGTPRSLARASDNLEVWRWDGEPFGDSFPVNPVGGQNITYNLRFAGQQYEPYTGYYQNWHRDYDPYTGRYLQADPLGLGGGLSRFTYALGNPLAFVDPDGKRPMPKWWDDGWAPSTRSGHCATGECAAGLLPVRPDNRTQAEIDVGQCTLVCNIATVVPIAACNAAAGGNPVTGLVAAASRTAVCAMVCKP